MIDLLEEQRENLYEKWNNSSGELKERLEINIMIFEKIIERYKEEND